MFKTTLSAIVLVTPIVTANAAFAGPGQTPSSRTPSTFFIPGTDQPLADQSAVFSDGTIDLTDRHIASSSHR
jgi:hypothetical protein